MFGFLPETLEVGGKEYPINSDFRACLAVLEAFNDNELTNRDKMLVMLTILYGEENLAKMTDYADAVNQAVWFLNCGRETDKDDYPEPPLMDWKQDEQLIFSGIAATVGRDIRMDRECHYWSFISYFMSMGECTFTAVKAIRHKLAKHKKLEQWEKDFYRDNREMVDVKRKEDWGESLFRRVFGRG